MNFSVRSYKKELLDADNIPFEDIKQNMKELDFINTWLGGHGITLAGLKEAIAGKNKISVCEIGCGGGDNLHAIVRYCNKKSIEINCIGIDIKQECVDYAKQQWKHHQPVEWLASDYKQIKFDEKPDVIFSSLFCHHFSDEELVGQLKWMQENSAAGFFINDLQRNQLAYYPIKWLTKFLSSSYLVKNDAPLSVARGFHKKEWTDIFAKAGIDNYSIQWKWAFRYLLIFKHE